MPNDPPKPPINATARAFSPVADNRLINDAQERILNSMREGMKRLIDQYIETSRGIVQPVLAQSAINVYNNGITNGEKRAAVVFLAYIDVLNAKHAARDPRAEPDAPPVTLHELQDAVGKRGVYLSAAECAAMAHRLDIRVASEP